MKQPEQHSESGNCQEYPVPTSGPARWIRLISWPVVCCLIGLVRFYQRAISPMIGPSCRFTPTCSSYTIQALKKYGLVWGSCKSFWRIVRCNPLGKGGIDPP